LLLGQIHLAHITAFAGAAVCLKQSVSEPSLFICLFADFCQYKDVFVGTAVSTSEDKSFCAVEMDALSFLTIIIIIVIFF